MRPPDAVVLLSGGLDSATALYWARRVKRWRCACLLVDYGQRHRRELQAARALARRTGSPWRIVRFRLPWGGSSLLGRRGRVPAHRPSAIGRGPLPSTYVPARNTIFLSFAASWADVLGARNIILGANALDYSGYPDCRPAYLSSFQRTARLGTRLGAQEKAPVRIWAPLVRFTKAAIIRRGTSWGVPYGATWSCYAGGRRPCGACDSCRLRAKGFEDAGVPDPLFSRKNNG